MDPTPQFFDFLARGLLWAGTTLTTVSSTAGQEIHDGGQLQPFVGSEASRLTVSNGYLAHFVPQFKTYELIPTLFIVLLSSAFMLGFWCRGRYFKKNVPVPSTRSVAVQATLPEAGDLDNLTVDGLRHELRRLGQRTVGLKRELIKRLLLARAEAEW